MSRLLAFAGILLLSLGLAGVAAAYYPPEITSAYVAGLNGIKSFRLTLKGPAPFDIASITVQGPSQTYPIDPSTQVQGGGAIQYYVSTVTGEGLPPNGDYTFTVTDNQGRSDSVVITYTDATPPAITQGDLTPADGAYTATITPTLSLTDQGGGMTYFFRIVDYNTEAIMWQSTPSSSNAVVVPSGVLQPNTPYRAIGYVTPHDMTPAYAGLSMSAVANYFYTGTRANPPSFDTAFIIYNSVYGTTPYRVAFFRIPGLAPWDFASGNFQVDVTPPGEGPVTDALLVQTRSWEACYYYGPRDLGAGSMSEGAYNLAVSDNLSNDIDVDRTYVEESVAPVDRDTIRPAHLGYVGSLQPYVTWQPPAGATADWRYVVRLRRYGSTATYVYTSPILSATNHKIDPNPPLKDNHTYLLNLVAYANSDPSANQYVNTGNTWAVVHVDSRLSNPSIYIPIIVH